MIPACGIRISKELYNTYFQDIEKTVYYTTNCFNNDNARSRLVEEQVEKDLNAILFVRHQIFQYRKMRNPAHEIYCCIPSKDPQKYVIIAVTSNNMNKMRVDYDQNYGSIILYGKSQHETIKFNYTFNIVASIIDKSVVTNKKIIKAMNAAFATIAKINKQKKRICRFFDENKEFIEAIVALAEQPVPIEAQAAAESLVTILNHNGKRMRD
jgi:hypothetical protein